MIIAHKKLLANADSLREVSLKYRNNQVQQHTDPPSNHKRGARGIVIVRCLVRCCRLALRNLRSPIGTPFTNLERVKGVPSRALPLWVSLISTVDDLSRIDSSERMF